MNKEKIVFILNPISGSKSKAKIPELIEENIDKERFDYEIITTERGGQASAIAQEAVREGVPYVVAIGGDGTVNEVARAVRDSKTAMGIIPCGSGNGLARHLMLPLSTKGAIEIINQAVVHDLDYGIINGMPFFCTCGMGFDAHISMKFAQAGRRGALTYIEKVLREGFTYAPDHYTIEDENGRHEHDAFLVSIANASQYGNDAYIAPQASMSDGLMDVIIMDQFGVLDAPNVSYDMMNKTLNQNPNIHTFRSKHLHIRREKPAAIHYDGEPIMSDTDLDISIREKGIRIIVNPKADKRRRHPTKLQKAMSMLMNGVSDVRTDIADTIKDAGETVTNTIKDAGEIVTNDIQQQGKKVQEVIKKLTINN